MSIGPYPIPGPTGPEGPEGPEGPAGASGGFTHYWSRTINVADNQAAINLVLYDAATGGEVALDIDFQFQQAFVQALDNTQAAFLTPLADVVVSAGGASHSTLAPMDSLDPNQAIFQWELENSNGAEIAVEYSGLTSVEVLVIITLPATRLLIAETDPAEYATTPGQTLFAIFPLAAPA